MTRRGNSSSTFYVSTNPQNNVPIGVAGHGVALGRLGPTIYNGSGNQPDTSELHLFGADVITYIPSTVIPTLEF